MTYEYHYENGEANFGAPLDHEVDGGAHITCDIILHDRTSLYILRRPDGLHDGPKNSLYFPHGLIRFGETTHQAAARLGADQARAEVVSSELYNLPSWVDENNHWHLCLNIFALVAGKPPGGDGVSDVVEVSFDGQADEFAWWTQEQFDAMTATLRRRLA